MQKSILIAASVLGALGVAFGAFGAHSLKAVLEQFQRLDTFDTAVKYHFYHAIMLFAIGMLMSKYNNHFIMYSALFIIAGIFLFSGSLYLLSIFNITKLAIITPFGGIFLISGWILLGIGVYKAM